MLISLGTVTVPVQHAAQVSEMLAGLAAQTRSEDGCVEYRVLQDLETPGRFAIIESFDNLL